jgi:hypothetical protein
MAGLVPAIHAALVHDKPDIVSAGGWACETMLPIPGGWVETRDGRDGRRP